MHLLCFFKYSGESYNACSIFFLHSTYSMFILFNFFQEQGRRNDLLSKCDGPVPQHLNNRHFLNSPKMMSSIVSTPGFSTNIISDRVHCDPLSCMASGSRCHTADYLKETKDGDISVPCLMYSLSKPPSPWVHVFSKSSANSSLCTQCVAVASVDAYCSTVFHRRLCHARNNCRKQDWFLQEMVVPPTQVTRNFLS
jgi:hypothetical protein